MSADHPQKRQRQTGSFSPASPPYHLAKPTEPAKTTLNQQPNTPTSPPYMSSAAQSQSHAYTSSLSSASGQGLTPPSLATMSQLSQQPTAASTSTFPTPASSAGTVSFAFKNEDGDAPMADEPMEGLESAATGDVIMGNDSDHRHTGHDRTGTGSSASDNFGLDRLNAGSGPFYKLSENPYSLSQPHVSRNLVSLYGLDHIAQSVARFNPKTGEKINKLRKSYENHVKDFKISGGKNRPEAASGQLMSLLEFPDEEWYAQKVRGRELDKGVSPLLEKMNRAVKMNPGKLSQSEEAKWKARIGTDDGSSKKPATEMLVDGPTKKLKQSGQGPLHGRSSATSSPALKPSPAAKPVSRPDRAGKKRSYVESSFKGYGEGFADDDVVGDSTGGEDEGRGAGAKKKRRKDFAAGSPLGFNERRGSYNVGMVGVRH